MMYDYVALAGLTLPAGAALQIEGARGRPYRHVLAAGRLTAPASIKAGTAFKSDVDLTGTEGDKVALADCPTVSLRARPRVIRSFAALVAALPPPEPEPEPAEAPKRQRRRKLKSIAALVGLAAGE